MKLLQKLRADRRIDEVLVESGSGHRASYFVHLKWGWRYGDAHCFGEDTLTDVRRTLSQTEPCDCLECRTQGAQWEVYDPKTKTMVIHGRGE